MDCTEDNRRSRIICVVLALVTFALFSPILNDGFINFDDGVYVTENPMVQNGLAQPTLNWAFTTSYAANWHPLTWISHALDCELYGLKPAGHHLTSLLLHVLNVLLLFQVLWRMTGAMWRSAVVAALFAWHPLHVESVAWVAERKDVLSTFFWLLTMLAYWKYAGASKAQSNAECGVRSAELGKGQRPKPEVYYGLALVCFALGLMAKPMLVTLPFVLLLLDYWPLNRMAEFGAPNAGTNKTGVARLVLEKAPFLLLALGSSVMTFFAQKGGGAVTSLASLSFGQRVTNALVSYVRYLGKMVWPVDLAVFYPRHPLWAPWQWAGAALLIAAVSLLAVVLLRRRPYFFAGWFWYLGTLVPVIGLVQVGDQSMADRYTYMPLVGIFIIFSWGVADLAGRGRLRQLSPAWGVIVPVLAACLAVTTGQIKYWKDSITLFRHALAVTTNNTLAHVDLGQALDQAGKTDEAKAELLTALKMEPDSPMALADMGNLFVHQGDMTQAASYFNSALSKQPFYGDAHFNLGNLLAHEGKISEAAEHYARALSYNPNAPDAQNNLGAMLMRLGRPQEAIEHFNAALRLNPNFPEAEDQLGAAYAKLGQTGQAGIHYAEAVRLKPDFAHARLKLGLIDAAEGHLDEATTQFLATIKLEPTNPVAYYNLGAAYVATRQLDKAFDAFSEAARLNPDDADSQGRLAGVLARLGKLDDAVKHYQAAILLSPDDAKLRGQLAAVLATQGNFPPAIESYWKSIRLKPDWPDPQRDLAWILATNPKAELRNGPEALRLAQRACELVGRPDPRFLSALEVAYAEVGRFDDAIKTAQQIQQLAAAPAQKRFAIGVTNRLELYRAGKPFHE